MSEEISYLDRAEANRLRAEKAEQERDLLKQLSEALIEGPEDGIDNFVAEAEPMLTELYEAMKKAKGHLYQKKYAKERMEAVKRAYRKDMVYFLPEWLEEESLYIFKRKKQYDIDFKGKLLQRAIEHHFKIRKGLTEDGLGKKARKAMRLRTT
jgi:hypothetical protein